MKSKATIWTVLGVIGAVVIAFFLVNVVFKIVGFLFQLAVVAIVAVIVFFVLRSLFARSGRDD